MRFRTQRVATLAMLAGCSGEVESEATMTGSAVQTEGSSGPVGSSADGGTTADAATTATPEVGSSSTTEADAETDTDPMATDGCATDGEMTLEIGHGVAAFEPVDAHPAELVHGVQGGFHITLGVRTRHADATDLSVVRLTATIDGQPRGSTAPYAELVCVGEQQEAVNLRLIFDAQPPELHQQTAHVTAELTDPMGRVVTAQADVVIDDPTLH